MPAPDNPAVAKLAMIFTRDTRQYVNTFHAVRVAGGAITFSDLQGMAATLADWWADNYRQQVADDLVLTQVQARKLDPDDPLAWDLNISPALAGTRTQAPAPGNATVSVSWRTGLAGRRFRGRFYSVGLCEDQQNDNDTLVSTVVTGLSLAAATLRALMTGQGFNLCIFHAILNTFTPINASVVESLVDSQRRRLAGRGR